MIQAHYYLTGEPDFDLLGQTALPGKYQLVIS